MADACMRARQVDERSEDGELTVDNFVGGLIEAEDKANLRALVRGFYQVFGG